MTPPFRGIRPSTKAGAVHLEEYRQQHQPAMLAVETALAELTGCETSSRLKTTNSIVAKLKRNVRGPLSQIQDIAGTRVVAEVNLAGQDALGSMIESSDRWAIVKRIDRRAMPMHGYRALHYVVSFDAVRVEVQLRTRLQHVWANLSEQFAGRWGQQIKYGEPPDNPGAVVPGVGFDPTRAELVDDLARFAGLIQERELESSGMPTAELDELIEELLDVFGQLLDA